MELGDLFWIKLFELKNNNYRYKDTLKIMRIAKEMLGVNLTFIEALNIWEYISGCVDAGWLNCDDDEYVENKLKDVFDEYLIIE